MNKKNHLKTCFNKAAASYDQHAVLQQCVGEKLIQLISQYFYHSTPTILDAGCGTGKTTQSLMTQLIYSNLHAIDIAEAPLAKAKARLAATDIFIYEQDFTQLKIAHGFDLIFSNMALHWSENLRQTLMIFSNALNDQGLLAFSLPLIGTFIELQSHVAVRSLMSSSEIEHDLQQAGFTLRHHQTESHLFYYEDTLAALKSIKQVGANYTGEQKIRSFLGKSALKRLSINQLTYEIGFFIAQKKQ